MTGATRALLAACFALAAQCASAQTVLYTSIDHAAGANTGQSWHDAFRGPGALQRALDAAAPLAAGGQTVHLWVARGAYPPTLEAQPGEPRSATFRLQARVALYGGFVGTETALGQRDILANPTILTGALPPPGAPLRAWHIVTAPASADATAILDGFTVTGGLSQQGGAGILSLGGAPRIRACIIAGNHAQGFPDRHGGGARCLPPLGSPPSLPSFEDCWFEDNSASGGGGGLAGAATLTRCAFTGNTAHPLWNGGAIAGDCHAEDCTFDDNHAGAGGAIQGACTLRRCLFEGNSADGGGALYGTFDAQDCQFIANAATWTGAGGAAYLYGPPSRFERCLFRANTGSFGALLVGGAHLGLCRILDHAGGSYFHILNAASSATGCTFSGNSARLIIHGPLVSCVFSGNAGGIEIGAGGSLVNCTVAANTWGQGAVRVGANVSTAIANSILWGNNGAAEQSQLQLAPGASLSLRYSCIQGLTPATAALGPGNFSANPRLEPAESPSSPPSGRLRTPSPCVDAGDPAILPPAAAADAFGAPRLVNDPGMPDNGPLSPPPPAPQLHPVDVGAFEHQGVTCYADCEQPPGPPHGPPILSTADFVCFLEAYQQGNPYTNCDASRTQPVLNVADFSCFLQRFAAGCP
ncbi:MAG: GC-type dockerin domain-anchored protein [Phycisphaerales bacterium]